ncbi:MULTISPECIES: C13 family peptidase [unclassified Mesotoga]|uniref:C13 family peptidase n=1 Tax=unclassified Mesotoga TaxID=1184398 RepID=UPI000DA6A95C|nr:MULTISPECIES: C13 family peptidase [unclassified Mesotoga]PZC51965.1 hypothetical protein LH53_07265 [Mesotoga sp. TolDC]
MRLKRVSIVIVAALIAMLLISSCIPKDPVAAATKKFIQFIESEGEPEGPFTGLLLGEVGEGDVIGSESAKVPQLQYQLQGINEAGYFFYLDEAPGAFYDHPGKLVVVSKGGQIIFEEDTEGWPTLNGNMVTAMSDREVYATAVIWDKWKIIKPIITVIDIDWIARFLRIKGAVITSGITPTQNLYAQARDVRNLMSDAFKAIMGSDRVRDVKYVSGAAAPNWTAVQAAINDLLMTEKVDYITLYFIAHGNTNLMNLGGTTFYANQLRSYILEHPNVKFCIIIESCHAGSWLEGLKSGGVTPANIEIIITTTTAAKSAYPDWDSAGGYADHNPTDMYVEWSGDFLQKLAYYTSDAHWPEVTAYADTKSIDWLPALFYKCYTAIKGVTPSSTSWTLTERSVAGSIQEPMRYITWTP